MTLIRPTLPPMAPPPALLALLALLALPTLPMGCATTPSDQQALGTDAGELDGAGLTESGHWQSAPWTDSRWIALPAISTVTVPHGLGRVPATIDVYLSFVEDDRGDRNPREFFLGAGDVANISAVSDSEVTVKNTTRGEYYFRLVVR